MCLCIKYPAALYKLSCVLTSGEGIAYTVFTAAVNSGEKEKVNCQNRKTESKSLYIRDCFLFPVKWQQQTRLPLRRESKMKQSD